MIRRIILENYMAHVRTVIEPAAGLTVLIGPNNCGKSAIIHALEMICYNSDAADFAIRHGTKRATVTVETVDDDGTVHTLVWWRKKGTAGYSIDGREISGLGRGIPDDLHQHLKMPEIPAATGKPFRIHFGLQKSPIFLLDDTQSRAAQFFASSSDADRLMEMQRRHTQKAGNAKRDKERLDREMAVLDQQLEIFAPLPGLSSLLVQLESQYTQLIKDELNVRTMQQRIEYLDHANQSHGMCQQRAAALVPLQQPPVLPSLIPLASVIEAMRSAELRAAKNLARWERLTELKPSPVLSETTRLSQLIGQLENAARRVDRDERRSAALADLKPVPTVGDAATLAQSIKRISRLTAQTQLHFRKADALAELAAPPGLVDIAGLKKHIVALEQTGQKAIRLQSRHRLLEALPAPCEAADTKPLKDLIARLETSAGDLLRTEKSLQLADRRLAELAGQIANWVALNPRCKTCGQGITAELILTGGHAHE